MLKTIKLTSFIALGAAAVVVIILLFIGFKGNAEVKALLDSPGVAERFKENGGKASEKEDIVSPLVLQARAFALRIDPPPPPKPKTPPKTTPVKTARKAPAKPRIPVPKVQATPKSNLLATVLYKSSPEKSLALFKAGSKQEWFRQGDRVGNHVISEIRDGSVILKQGGKKLPEQFVPAKTSAKSLLKGEKSTSPVSQPSPAAGNLQLPTPRGGTTASPAGSATASQQPGGTINTNTAETRSVQDPVKAASTSQPRKTGSTDSIRRIRKIPKQATPVEQKESLDKALTGIEALMNREDSSLDDQERQKENEVLKSFMEALKKQQKQLDSETDVQNTEPKTNTQKQKPEEKKTSADKPQSNSKRSKSP